MMFRRSNVRPWFLYQKGAALTSGAAQFGFLGDGSMSNRIPYLATGSQGQMTQRCLGIQASSTSNVNASLPPNQLFVTTQGYGTMGLVTDPNAIAANSGTISPGGNFAAPGI